MRKLSRRRYLTIATALGLLAAAVIGLGFAVVTNTKPGGFPIEKRVALILQTRFNEQASGASVPYRMVKDYCRTTKTTDLYDCRAQVVGVGGRACYAVLVRYEQPSGFLKVVVAMRQPQCVGDERQI